MNNIGCGLCGASDRKLLICSRCKSVSYCSKDHQRQDWKRQHKLKCTIHQGDITCENASEGTSRASDDDFGELQKPLKGTKRNPKKNLNTKSKSNKVSGFSNGSKTLGVNDWNINNTLLFTDEGSSESEILNARTETLEDCNYIDSEVDKSEKEKEKEREDLSKLADISLNGPPFLHCDEKSSILEEVSINVIRDMDAYGVCVVDHFLGPEMGKKVLDEVISMYSQGVFKDGQTVSARATSDVKTIRGDQITWLDGKESQCKSIGSLITKVDTVIKQANKVCKVRKNLSLKFKHFYSFIFFLSSDVE